MGDDLSAFFAKKKDKKKKVAVKIDDVGQILERKVRRQEENDVSDDEEKRVVEDDHRRGSEDSDWIELGDSNQGRLEGLKIRDLTNDVDTLEEEAEDGDEQKEPQEPVKTWGQVDKKEDHDVETDAAMAAYQRPSSRPAKFVPSALRNSAAARDIDVANQEMFPSLADATKIEKDKKDDTKMTTGGGWIKSGTSESKAPTAAKSWGGPSGGPPPGATKDRELAIAAVKELAALNNNASPISRPAPPVPEVNAAPKPGSYVPPHLRNK